MKRIDETRVKIDSKTVPRTFESYLRRTVPISVVVECFGHFFTNHTILKKKTRTGRAFAPKIAYSKRSPWLERRIETESWIAYTHSAPDDIPAIKEATTDMFSYILYVYRILLFFLYLCSCVSLQYILCVWCEMWKFWISLLFQRVSGSKMFLFRIYRWLWFFFYWRRRFFFYHI